MMSPVADSNVLIGNNVSRIASNISNSASFGDPSAIRTHCSGGSNCDSNGQVTGSVKIERW
jgi:hypothetical protein